MTNSTWHGTHMAGMIGAVTNNGQGIASVDWGVKPLSMRVLGKWGETTSDICAGFRSLAYQPAYIPPKRSTARLWPVPHNPSVARQLMPAALSSSQQTTVIWMLAMLGQQIAMASLQ